MSPSESQLTFWCDLHNIVLSKGSGSVRATAYDANRHPITTVTRVMPHNGLKADHLAHALLACDDIAEELLLVKPSIAYKLNNS